MAVVEPAGLPPTAVVELVVLRLMAAAALAVHPPMGPVVPANSAKERFDDHVDFRRLFRFLCQLSQAC